MSTRPHYFKIGIFVIIAVILIVAAAILFGAGLLSRDVMRFESYFAESITGLTVGAPLEFRGVRIGQVEQIGFVGTVYRLEDGTGAAAQYTACVRVVTSVPRARLPEFAGEQIEVALKRMIDRGWRVRVSSNILTGLAYLEANYVDPNRFPVADVPWEPIHFHLPSAPGELSTIKDSIDRILTQLEAIDAQGLVGSMERLFNSLNQVVTDANVPELSAEARALLAEGRRKMAALQMEQINADAMEFLASLNRAVADADIPRLSRRARDLIDAIDQKFAQLNVQRINDDIERLLGSLDKAVADANIPALSQEATSLLTELRDTNQYLQDLLAPPDGLDGPPSVPEVIARLSRTLTQLNDTIAAEGPGIDVVVKEFQEVAAGLNELISTLREQPSSLLFGRPPRRSEVFE